MTVDIALWVTLKGADLVASTAYLTLVDKMGFRDNLLGLKRLGVYAFSITTDDPVSTISRLKRALSVQSTFYNRNKHNYFLECRWDGQVNSEGVAPDDLRRRLTRDVAHRFKIENSQDLDSLKSRDRVMLKNIPVYRAEILVEDRENAAKIALASQLESELSAPVTVSTLGTCWYLVLSAESEEQARTVAEDITVTKRRDRGLLLNPNDQGCQILSLEALDLSRE